MHLHSVQWPGLWLALVAIIALLKCFSFVSLRFRQSIKRTGYSFIQLFISQAKYTFSSEISRDSWYMLLQRSYFLYLRWHNFNSLLVIISCCCCEFMHKPGDKE